MRSRQKCCHLVVIQTQSSLTWQNICQDWASYFWVLTKIIVGISYVFGSQEFKQQGSIHTEHMVIISSVQFSCSVVSDFLTPWAAARQDSLTITNSWSLLKLMSIESVMPSNLLVLCRTLLLLPSILPSIRVFSYESVLPIRWPKYWSFSFSISRSNEYSGLISFRMVIQDS